jgi:repressor LexA
MSVSVGDRIKQRRIALGLSADELAQKLNKNRATIYRYESSEIENLPTSILEPLAKALETTPAHLMGWDNQNSEIPSSQYSVVPAGIAAGSLEEIDCMMDLPQASVPDIMMGRWAGNHRVVLMHVNGTSMDRVIPDRSVIAVLTGTEPEDIRNGDIVVATDGDRTYTVKRFYDDKDNHRLILRPDSNNPSFLPIVFPYDQADDLKIIGKVVIYSVFLS